MLREKRRFQGVGGKEREGERGSGEEREYAFVLRRK